MTTCPWCGTHFEAFHSTCRQCGGTMPLPPDETPGAEAGPQAPPLPPRQVPRSYIRRILLADPIATVAGILALIGAIFLAVGLGLVVPAATAIVGLVFVILGLSFLAVSAPLLAWRHSRAKALVDILREGTPVHGQIVSVYQSYHVRVNGRFPWSIVYRFGAAGEELEGRVSTLSTPDLSQQAGKPVYVLYARDNPRRNTIYPHPYGYYGP